MSSDHILLITGGNAGLGFETVKSLCKSSQAYTIIIGGRDLRKAVTAAETAQKEFPNTLSTLDSVQIDIEDDDSIVAACETVSSRYGRLDILINNAGGQFDQQVRAGQMTLRDVWIKSWNVNTVGTQIVTNTFVPLLLKAANPRIIFIASGTSTLEESANEALPVNRSPAKGWPKQDFGVPAYRSSKTGMNMMMREWARVLKNDGVKLWCVSPGYLATSLGGDQTANKNAGAIDPSIGANFVRDVIEGGRDQDVGKVIRRDNIQPW